MSSYHKKFVDTINIMFELIERASTTDKRPIFINHVLSKTEMVLEGMKQKLQMNEEQQLLLQTVEWKFTVFKAELYLDYISFLQNDTSV